MSDPDAMFGPARETWEYVDGELVVRSPDGTRGPAPAGDGGGAGAPVPGNA